MKTSGSRAAIIQPSQEEERLREQLRTLQQKDEKQEEEKKVESEVSKMQNRKKEIRIIVKKDLRDQSESVK